MSKATILIVEDEAIIAADLAGTLRRLGYEICGTTGLGEEAIDLARERRPDMVLMDIRLAGAMDGIEAAEIIHRELDLPVIYLTAHSDQATLERAKLSEPFGYLLKPFEELGLETHIEMALYKHRAEQKLRQAYDELEMRVQERTRELSEAHKMVQAERQRLYDVLETLPVYVVLLDRDYHVPFANRFFRERFGESGGKRCYEYPFGRSEPCEICETYSGLKTKASHHWEWAGPDGRNYDIYDYPFVDSDGSGMILEMGIDITERKQAERALEEVNETLEQRIAERTAELQAANTKLLDSRRAALNMMEDAVVARRQAEDASAELRVEVTERKRAEDALQKAKVAAEAANRAKSQFLANMSHELRTPMNGILGFLQLTLNGTLEPQQRDFLEKVHKSARSLLRILNDILDLSRIEAGRLSLEEKAFPLRECIIDAVEIFSYDAQHKGLSYNISISDDVPEAAIGDYVRLRQVMINLIGNAVKYTDRGEIDVRAVFITRPDGGPAMTFSITDTGIGIPEEKRNLLFRSFSQVDDSNTRSYGGVGLGLAISKKIVEMMGGTISLESEEGKGSTFSFTVPLPQTDLPDAAPVTVPPSEEVIAPAPDMERKPRLLVAEDDPMAGVFLKNVLELYQFEMDLVTSGIDAVEKWETGTYDLIIMDVQMPKMDGHTATRLIREKEKERGGHIPILAMTAHAFREDREGCIAAGMDAYITKPLDVSAGFDLITEMLRKSGG